MKRAAMHLYEVLLSALEPGELKGETPQQRWLTAIGIVSDAITRLKQLLTEQSFDSTEEEISFFKELKPGFDGYLIYYLRLLNRQEFLPASTAERILFYQRELQKLSRHRQVSREFIRYMESGATYNDAYYFRRSEHADTAFLEDYEHVYDPRFNTRMSRKAALLRACQLLAVYYEDQLIDLKGQPGKTGEQVMSLQWESPKVGLAELIYALYATGCFGNVELQQVVRFMTGAFGVRFANPYKVFEEIRMRKKNRTSFLDFLRLNLLRRMDHDDEFSL